MYRNGDFEQHLRTNFEVPEVYLDRAYSACVVVGTLVGLENVDKMGDTCDPQLFLTNRAPKEVNLQRIADCLFTTDYGAMLLEYYIKMTMRIARGANVDPDMDHS